MLCNLYVLSEKLTGKRTTQNVKGFLLICKRWGKEKGSNSTTCLIKITICVDAHIYKLHFAIDALKKSSKDNGNNLN